MEKKINLLLLVILALLIVACSGKVVYVTVEQSADGGKGTSEGSVPGTVTQSITIDDAVLTTSTDQASEARIPVAQGAGQAGTGNLENLRSRFDPSVDNSKVNSDNPTTTNTTNTTNPPGVVPGVPGTPSKPTDPTAPDFTHVLKVGPPLRPGRPGHQWERFKGPDGTFYNGSDFGSQALVKFPGCGQELFVKNTSVDYLASGNRDNRHKEMVWINGNKFSHTRDGELQCVNGKCHGGVWSGPGCNVTGPDQYYLVYNNAGVGDPVK